MSRVEQTEQFRNYRKGIIFTCGLCYHARTVVVLLDDNTKGYVNDTVTNSKPPNGQSSRVEFDPPLQSVEEIPARLIRAHYQLYHPGVDPEISDGRN